MEEEKKKFNSGLDYKNGKYRPNVFFEKSLQSDIETMFHDKGYKSFNEWVNAIVLDRLEQDRK